MTVAQLFALMRGSVPATSKREEPTDGGDLATLVMLSRMPLAAR
jgi:hypothetical protein